MVGSAEPSVVALESDHHSRGKSWADTKTQYSWQLLIDGQPHRIDFTNSKTSGKKRIFVDGRLLHEQKVYRSGNFQFNWPIGQHLLSILPSDAEKRQDTSPSSSIFSEIKDMKDDLLHKVDCSFDLRIDGIPFHAFPTPGEIRRQEVAAAKPSAPAAASGRGERRQEHRDNAGIRRPNVAMDPFPTSSSYASGDSTAHTGSGNHRQGGDPWREHDQQQHRQPQQQQRLQPQQQPAAPSPRYGAGPPAPADPWSRPADDAWWDRGTQQPQFPGASSPHPSSTPSAPADRRQVSDPWTTDRRPQQQQLAGAAAPPPAGPPSAEQSCFPGGGGWSSQEPPQPKQQLAGAPAPPATAPAFGGWPEPDPERSAFTSFGGFGSSASFGGFGPDPAWPSAFPSKPAASNVVLAAAAAPKDLWGKGPRQDRLQESGVAAYSNPPPSDPWSLQAPQSQKLPPARPSLSLLSRSLSQRSCCKTVPTHFLPSEPLQPPPLPTPSSAQTALMGAAGGSDDEDEAVALRAW